MISIIIPVYNEDELIDVLYSRVTKAMEALGDEYEVIAVDDGSTDRSRIALTELHQKDQRWKLLAFSRNFGHQTAISAGLYYCTGKVVAVMDADLQDPPEELHRFIQKWKEGYQVVYAIRSQRKENVFKRFAYWAFYRTLRLMSSINIPLDSGDFCVMDRAVVDVLRSLPERTRFVRGLRTWAGFRQIGIAYERHARQAGETKYPLPKLFKLAFDGIVSFSSFPLRIASWIGCILCTASIALLGFVVLWWSLNMAVFGMRPGNVLGWTSLACLVLFLAGIQMLMLGITGAYVARIYDEVKARDPWIIAEARGFSAHSVDSASGWYASRGRLYNELTNLGPYGHD